MKRKRIFCAVLSIFLLCLLILLADRLLMPKYMTSSREGALIGEYYDEIDEGRRHDVIFIGDCEVYESFIPAIIWEESGITSYVRGSPAQLVWQSYYLLEEMLELDSPDLVVFNVYAMNYSAQRNEAYNRMTLDGMRMSQSKISAIKASMTEGEEMASYILPILRFHDRWSKLSREDIEYFFWRDTVSHNGYLMQTDIVPQTYVGPYEECADHALPQICFDYLDKMRRLCEQKGVELVLVKAPTNSWRYFWYDEWDAEIREYADDNCVDYYNLINEEIGLDFSHDSYDGGLHLNVYGAEKVSRFFASLLSERYFPDMSEASDEVVAVWEEKLDEYYNEKTKETEK